MKIEIELKQGRYKINHVLSNVVLRKKKNGYINIIYLSMGLIYLSVIQEKKIMFLG